jgi:hypothetical protein
MIRLDAASTAICSSSDRQDSTARHKISPLAGQNGDVMTELMSEFPPAPERQVPLANWRTSPLNRWAFQHVREIVPSADIPHDPATARPLQTAAANIDRLRISDAQAAGLTLDAFMQRASTDALVILYDSRIVIERYGNGMGPRTPHILMSVCRSHSSDF